MLKAILSNTAAQLVAKVIGVLLTFATTVLIIRAGGPELFGDLTKSLSLVAIGFTLIDFGLNAGAVRAMRGKEKDQLRILVNTIVSRLVLAVLGVCVVNLVVYVLPGGYTTGIKSVFWIGSLAILFQGIYTSFNAWFQRKLQYWRSTIAMVAGAIVGTALTVYAMTNSPTLTNLLFASTAGYGVMALVALLLGPRVSINDGGGWPGNVRTTLSNSLPLGLILVFSVVASKVDSIILGVFRSSFEVGQYGFAYRVFDVALVLPVFVMNAVYPLLLGSSRDKKQQLISRSSKGLLITSLLGVVSIWLTAPYLARIREDMGLAIGVVRVLAIGLPFFYLTAPLMWQLIEAKLEKYVVWVYLGAAVFNGASNLLLVPQYGIYASALLTLASEALILAGLYLIKVKHYGRS